MIAQGNDAKTYEPLRPAPRITSDARADGGRRLVTFDARRIVIERSLRGIAMRIGVPANAYAGVVLSLDAAPNGERLYRVSLLHADAELAIVLQEGGEEVLEAWKGFASFFALPRLVARHDGRLEPVAEPVRIAHGPSIAPRHRGSLTSGRRGRFARRRRMGASNHTCFDPTREIISYE
jgi:hypothetical protein